MQQLQQLEKQITQSGASEAEVEALKRKVAELEGEVAKRATKKTLSKKISDLQKQLQQPEEESEEAEEAEEAEEEKRAKKVSGKGIVAVDEIQRDALGNYDWFEDLLKAHKKLTGFQ
jgi:predicted RNase H-like nuclease (RuvC/YqgF family)